MNQTRKHIKVQKIVNILGFILLIAIIVYTFYYFYPPLIDTFIKLYNIFISVFVFGIILIIQYVILKTAKINLSDKHKLAIDISDYIKSIVVSEPKEALKFKFDKLREEFSSKRKIKIDLIRHGFFERSYLALISIKFSYFDDLTEKINIYTKLGLNKNLIIEFVGICLEKNVIDFESVILVDENIKKTLNPEKFLIFGKPFSGISQNQQIKVYDNVSNKVMKLKIATDKLEKCKTFLNNNIDLIRLAKSSRVTGIITINNYLILAYYLDQGFNFDEFEEPVKSSIKKGTLLELIKKAEKL
ncbi:MAG: hypothetical protein N3E37_03820 [Candidatus Micrarchaeota archaeon]|nr:hypothetical protein [Candidatus Micrarchaeota archaeon]